MSAKISPACTTLQSYDFEKTSEHTGVTNVCSYSRYCIRRGWRYAAPPKPYVCLPRQQPCILGPTCLCIDTHSPHDAPLQSCCCCRRCCCCFRGASAPTLIIVRKLWYARSINCFVWRFVVTETSATTAISWIPPFTCNFPPPCLYYTPEARSPRHSLARRQVVPVTVPSWTYGSYAPQHRVHKKSRCGSSPI